jgi:hypothetical protein
MVTRRTTRPLVNFLLRVPRKQGETLGMRYALVDLQGSGVRGFAPMRTLAQYVVALQRSAAARPSRRALRRWLERARANGAEGASERRGSN